MYVVRVFLFVSFYRHVTSANSAGNGSSFQFFFFFFCLYSSSLPPYCFRYVKIISLIIARI